MNPTVPGRAYAQGLDAPRFETAVDVVRHLGAVQSQLHDMALWAVSRRIKATTTKTELDGAFAAGDFLRTHVLRPTWHFVDPSDIHWLLALTAPRVRRLMASSNSSLGLTETRLDLAADVIVELLADGSPRTRSELATTLDESGFGLSGQSLAHAMMHAEIAALVVNGPMRGKQHTYVRLDSIVTPPPTQPRNELLALVARRYARGHGPFRDKDLAWWTSLTLAESRRAIELGELRPMDVHGDTYWSLDNPVVAHVPGAMLLSNFDEYISYARDPRDYEMFDGSPNDLMRSSGLLALDGKLAGSWTRTVKTEVVEIEVRSSPTLTGPIRRGIESESDAYGRFIEREPVLHIC